MLQLRHFRDRLFRSSNAASVFSTGCFCGMLFIMPTFLQQVHSVSAFEPGLTTFPEALGVLTMSQLVGRVYPRIGPRRLMIAGLGGMATVLVGIAVTDLGTSMWVYRILMFLSAERLDVVPMSARHIFIPRCRHESGTP